MEKFKSQIYETKCHSEDIDSIFGQNTEDLTDVVFENRNLLSELKLYFRYLRKVCKNLKKENKEKNFTNVMYVTLNCFPYTIGSKEDLSLEYITQIQKQYPDKDIRILVPIVGLDKDLYSSKNLSVEIGKKIKNLEKTSVKFKFFIQNRVQKAEVYKFTTTNSNVKVYGLYSPIFSYCKNTTVFSRLFYLAPFIKAARVAIKKMGLDNFVPDIVHCENIPFFLGAEFETTISHRVKVLQLIKDFATFEIAKTEAFWAVINLGDKKTLKILCNDFEIKKYLVSLYKIYNPNSIYKTKSCLDFIYKNYYKLRRYLDQGEDVDENYIFKKLNSRTLQIFPQFAYGEDFYFNTLFYTLKKCDKWIVNSKTYYDEIMSNIESLGKMYKYIEKYLQKGDYVIYGADMNNYPLENTRDIYQCFNIENFREHRKENKKILLKELSENRIATNFVDPTLFNDDEVKILGYLDSFYNAPILLITSNSEIYANGIDIALNSVLKLYEYHKNIQVIINIKGGNNIGYVQNCLEHFSQNKYIKGKWIYIDGELNLPKFLAASDMILLPRRSNLSTKEHYLAMHYGCIPIVSRSGILNDTISDVFEDINLGCGFKSKTGMLVKEDSTQIFLNPLMKALGIYQNNPSSWNLLIKNCLNKPCGWNFKMLEKYNELYTEMFNTKQQ